MKSITHCILAILLLVSTNAFADSTSDQTIQALSAWTNQRGSTLYIDSISSTGQVTGHYINRAAGYNCQNISYPVTGWVYGTAITFTTLWQSQTESCNSITSWTGFYYQGQISTLWQLTKNGSTSTSQILQGSDVFNRTTKSDKNSLLQEK